MGYAANSRPSAYATREVRHLAHVRITWLEGLRGEGNPTPGELRRCSVVLGGYHIDYDATGHALDVTISNSIDAHDWAVTWVEK